MIPPRGELKTLAFVTPKNKFCVTFVCRSTPLGTLLLVPAAETFRGKSYKYGSCMETATGFSSTSDVAALNYFVTRMFYSLWVL